jgi:hypothetical protein
MVNCPECQREISEHAHTCPECGMKQHTLTAGMVRMTRKMEAVRDEVQADPEAFKARMAAQRAKSNPNITGAQAVSIVFLLFLAVWLYVKFVDEPKDKRIAAERSAKAAEQAEEQAKANDPKERKIARIKAGLDKWDGAPKKLKALIKEGMNDPDSFQHDKIKVDQEGDDYLVITEHFRGKNQFGGVVRNWVRAKIDLDGNVLQVYKTSADE